MGKFLSGLFVGGTIGAIGGIALVAMLMEDDEDYREFMFKITSK